MKFEFDRECDPRKAMPYVAELVLDKDTGKVKRIFKNELHREYQDKDCRTYGKYNAENGDIIEEQVGGSWSQKRRLYYIIKDSQKVDIKDYFTAIDLITKED